MHIDFIEVANFRKLLKVRISLSPEKTVFVGANNSGKTSAMIAMRQFLLERERGRFTLNDVTLLHWPAIKAMGDKWEKAHAAKEPLPAADWSSLLPSLDVWLKVESAEVHLVQKLIPTLDWEGGRLGVRLRLEPRDAGALQKEYLAAKEQAETLERATGDEKTDDGTDAKVIIWPRDLTEFLQRRLSKLFIVKSYILDPAKLQDPKHGAALPQMLDADAEPIDGEPFKGLIRIDEISAQRGFGQQDTLRDDDTDQVATGASATRRLSEQLRRYWNRHLDPYDNPNAQDLEALKAIESAQRAFDERLSTAFKPAIDEVQGLGYPGTTDPRLNISTRLRPIDGLNHESAVQYMIRIADGESSLDLMLPEDSNGLGYQNLISMIFRLMSYRDSWMRVGKAGAASAPDAEAQIPPLHLVLIEEPEAYLHTQVQQVFIRRAYSILRKHRDLQAEGNRFATQMVVSTHSSHVAHACDFGSLRYFRRLPADVCGVPSTCVINLGNVFGDDKETERFVTRYLKVTHNDLFFADAAVLIEGSAERILVPYFLRTQKELQDLEECYVCWMDIGGSHAHRLQPLIEQIGLTTLIIADLDAMTTAQAAKPPARGAGLLTRNTTLKTWWPCKTELDDLVDLTATDKVKSYPEARFSVCVAYQSPTTIDFGALKGEALANTLEDALVLKNLDYFSKANGVGLLKKFKKSIEESKNIRELNEKLFDNLKDGGKAELALDLLEIEDSKSLLPPDYIRDGFIWLLGQLRQKTKDLEVVATPSSPPEASAKAA